MRVLANVFHPHLEKSRVARAWADALEGAGAEVRRHRGEALDLEAEREACERADRLLFVHPLHWYAAPWPMKQWIDDVLSFGWAYGGPDRIAGKQWMHAVSVGAVADEYGREGSRVYTVEELMRPFERTAAFCGVQYVAPHLLYGAGLLDEPAVERSCEDLIAAVMR